MDGLDVWVGFASIKHSNLFFQVMNYLSVPV